MPVLKKQPSMRVLHVVAGISPVYGGTTQAVLEMCQALRRAGVEADIATTDEDGAGGNWAVPLGRPVEIGGMAIYHFHSPFLRRYGVSPGLVGWSRRNIRRYDLVHIHGFFSYVVLPSAYVAQRNGLPYLVRPSGELDSYSLRQRGGWKRIYLWGIGARILQDAAAIHCTSELERTHVERLGIPVRTAVIPLGVNSSFFQAFPRGEFREKYPWVGSRKIVLFLSRLAPKKGLDLLIPALASLRRDDFVLVIAGLGSPDYERQVRDMVRDRGLASRTIFTGFVQGEDKYAVLADADIFVLPSRDENFGLAVAEAMAAGLPVIISDQVAFHLEVETAQAGILVPCTVTGVAEGLRRLLDDAPLRCQMGGNGRRLVQERYSWERVTNDLVSLYRSL